MCFESLWTCLGDNNSPDDACLACEWLILPQTRSATPQFNHLYLPLCPAFPPSHIFTVPLWLAASVTYISYSCVYIITCGTVKSRESNLISGWLCQVSSHLFGYSCLNDVFFWYAAGRRRSINWTHFCRSTVQGDSSGKCNRKENNSKCQSHCHHVTPKPYRWRPLLSRPDERKLNDGLAHVNVVAYRSKAKQQ